MPSQSSPRRVNLFGGGCPNLPKIPLYGILPTYPEGAFTVLTWESEALWRILPRSPHDAFTVLTRESEPLWGILPRSPQNVALGGVSPDLPSMHSESSPGRVKHIGEFCPDFPKMLSQSSPGRVNLSGGFCPDLPKMPLWGDFAQISPKCLHSHRL